jgi:hypothetical protein
MTGYRLRYLGKLLKGGDARIVCKATGGDRWPDPPHLWVIDDLLEQKTYHVPCTTRPTWGRYREERP